MMRLASLILISITLGILSGHTKTGADVPNSDSKIGGINCTHFWERNNDLIPSGKLVGRDVGDPPNGSFERTGTYHCNISLTKSDAINGRYLFIGEVGDASYLQVTHVNGRAVEGLPVNHGLSPDPTQKAIYTRYIPFVVSLRDVYVEDGVHEFTIRYRDLFPFQVGIRSGPLTIEAVPGVIKRTILCSPTFTFHLIQILVLVLLGISFLVWPNIPVSNRFAFTAAALASAIVVLQLSAIPRSFLPQIWAMRLNDFSQLATFPIIGWAFLIFFRPKRTMLTRRLVLIHSTLSLIAILILGSIETRNSVYLLIFGISGLTLAGLPCFALGWAISRNWLHYAGGPFKPKKLSVLYLLLGALYIFDFVNFSFLHSRYYYFNHFLFFSSLVLSLWYLQSHVSPNEVRLWSDLETRKKRAYAAVASKENRDTDTLALFTKDLADLLNSTRVSIQEIVDGRLRFVGYFGQYSGTQGLHEIRLPSLIADAIRTRSIQYERMPSGFSSGATTDVAVVPLENNSQVIGVMCITDFLDGGIPQFYKDRMAIIKQECEPVLSLLISERHNRSKDRLIQMVHNRTHPLQLRSEEHFLKCFDISPTLQNHAFIYGDLVGSVELNERYRETRAVERAIDEHLALVWEKFKHLGVVVSRTKGDMISFVVPNQISDKSEAEAVSRCYEILSYLSVADADFQKIGRANGIALPLRYRFALSVIPKALRSNSADESLKSFNLLVDEAIDRAARVISGVALDGECLVMEAAQKHITSDNLLVELDSQRLKGKALAVRLWTLNGDILKNVA